MDGQRCDPAFRRLAGNVLQRCDEGLQGGGVEIAVLDPSDAVRAPYSVVAMLRTRG